ncbi:MAG: O-antigen ligase family protein [Candidatus Uhrbacteria bacterium]
MIYPSALIIATVLFAAIAWRDVRHGVYLIAAALPTYLLRFSAGPVPMTFLETMILVLVCIYIAKTMPSLRSIVPKGWALPMGLFLLAATAGVIVAPDRLSALGIWKAFYVEPMMLFVVIVGLIRRDDHPCPLLPMRRGNVEGLTVENLFVALAAGGLFVATFAIVQKALGVGIPVPWDVEGRVTSVFPYPNAVGLYLGPIVVMSLLQFIGTLVPSRPIGTKVPGKPLLWLATTVLGSVAIVLAQSEAAVGAVVATLFLVAVSTKRFRKAAVTVAVIATVLVAAISPLRHYVLDKLTFRDYSETVRLSQWTETVDMLRDRPIFGAGLNGYPTAMLPYHKDAQFEIFQYPHTLILNIWVELGVLGLVAFFLIAYRVFITSFPSPLKGEGQGEVYAVAFALLTMTLHSLFDVPYFKNDLAAMTWIFLAVVASSVYAKNSRVLE